MPELPTQIKDDSESIIGCVYSREDPGTVLQDVEVWSKFLRVQKYEMISLELAASNIPTDTMVFIETSIFTQEPTTASDWFVEDSYTWDPLCSNFKYINHETDARFYRVRIVCGNDGDLTDLAWVLGAKHT